MVRGERLLDGSVRVQFDAEDLNTFFDYSQVLESEGQSNRQIVRGTQVEISAKTLKTTTLFDLSNVLSPESLQNDHRLSFLRRLRKMPGLNNRWIAIAIEGKPIEENRVISLRDPIISIGQVSLKFSQASWWLGISEPILQERLNREWESLPIDLSDIQIVTTESNSTKSIQALQLQGHLTAW